MVGTTLTRRVGLEEIVEIGHSACRIFGGYMECRDRSSVTPSPVVDGATTTEFHG